MKTNPHRWDRLKATRRWLIRALVALLLCAVVAGAMLYGVRSTRIVWDPAEAMGSWGLGKALKVPCEIAKLSGDPLRAVDIEGLTIGRDKASPFGAWVTVDAVAVRHSVLAMVRRVPPAEAVSIVRMRGVKVYAHRTTDGDWNLTKLVPEPKEPKKPPPKFRGKVTVEGIEVYFRDDTVPKERGGTFKARFDIKELFADFGKHPEVSFRIVGSCPDGTFQSLTAQGTADLETTAVKAVFGLMGIDLPTWTRLAPLPEGTRVADGVVTVSGNIDLSGEPEARDLRYKTTVNLAGLTVFTPQVKGAVSGDGIAITAQGAVKMLAPPDNSPGDAPKQDGDEPAIVNTSGKTTVAGTATFAGTFDGLGAVDVSASYDTDAGLVDGRARLGNIACSRWLNALGVNGGARMSAGNASLDTGFTVAYPVGQPTRLDLDGMVRLTGGRLHPAAVKRPLTGLSTNVDYDLAVTLGDDEQKTAVRGDATIRGGLTDFPHYEVQCKFDTQRPPVLAHLRLERANVLAIPALLGESGAFTPESGRLGVDMDFRFDPGAGAPVLDYDGRVSVAGLSGQLKKLPQPFASLDVDLDVSGSAPLTGTGTVTTEVLSRQPLPRIGTLGVQVAYALEGGDVAVDVDASNVDVPFWSAMVLPEDGLSVLEGSTETQFAIATKPSLHYEAKGTLRDVVVRLPQIERDVSRISGQYNVTADSVTLSGITAALDHSFFVTDGTVTDFSAPKLDLQVRGERLNIEELLLLVPNQEPLPRVAANGDAEGTFSVAGQVSSLDVTGEARLPDLALEYRDYGSFQFHPMPVAVAVTGIRTEEFGLDIRLKEARVDLNGMNPRLVGVEAGQVAFAEPATLGIQVTRVDKETGVDVAVAIPSMRLGETRLTQLAADVANKAGTTTVSNIVVHTGDGSATADVTVASDDETTRLDVRGTAKDFDLGLAQTWLGERHLTVNGLASGPFTVVGPKECLAIGGQLALAQARVTQQVSDEDERLRRFTVPSGEVTLALVSARAGETTEVSGDLEVDVASLEAVLPGKEPDAEQTFPVGRVRGTLELGPKAIASEKIEAEAYGGQLALSDFRYDFEPRLLVAGIQAKSVALASLADFTKREDLHGTGDFAGELKVSEEGPSVKGEVTVAGLRVAESPECQVEGELSFQRGRLELPRVEAAALGCTVTGKGHLLVPADEKDTGELDFTVEGGGRIRQLAKTYAPKSLTLGGELHVDATVGGTFETPTIAGSAWLTKGRVKGLLIDQLEVEASSVGQTAHLKRLDAKIGGGSLHAEGKLNAEKELEATFQADPIPLSLLLAAADIEGSAHGAIRAKGSVSGTTDDPVVAAEITSEGLSLNGGGHSLGSLTGTVNYRDKAVQLNPLTWRLNGGTLTVQGRVPLSKPEPDVPPTAADQFDCQANWEHLSFSELREVGASVAELLNRNAYPVDGLDNALLYFRGLTPRPPEALIAGRLDLKGTQRNPEVTHAHLAVTEGTVWTVTGDTVGKESFPDLDVQAGYANRKITVHSLTASLGDLYTAVNGEADLDGDVDLDVVVRNFPLALVNPWVSAAPDVSGLADLIARIDGPVESPRIQGSLDIFEPALRSAVLDHIGLDYFVLEDGAFTIDEDALTMVKGDHTLSLSCKIPVSYKGTPIPRDKPFTAAAKLVQGDLRLLKELVPSVPAMFGELDADLHASGTIDQPLFDGFISTAETNIELPGMDSNVHGLTGEIRFEEGRRAVFKNFSAMLSTAPADTTLLPQFRKEALRLSGDILLTDKGLKRPLENVFDLLLELNALELKLTDTSALRDLNSRVTVKTRETDGREVATLETFSARGENDSGPLTAEGSLVVASDARKFPDALRDSEVNFRASADSLTLARAPYGRLTFDIQDLTFANDEANQGVPLLSAILNVHDTKLSAPKHRAPVEGEVKLPDFPNMSIFVMLGERVQASHPVLKDILVDGAVQISGSPADILVTGTLSSEQGIVRLPKAEAKLQRADVHIQVQTDEVTGDIVPRVWVSALATAEVDDYRIDINIRGPLLLAESGESELELRMTSRPHLAQEQIYALLIGTSPGSGLTGASLQKDLKDQFKDKIVSVFASQASGIFTREIREALGLDQLDLVWEDDRFSEVALGKRFGRLSLGVRKTLGRSAFDTAFQAEYRFSEQFAAEYEKDEFENTNLRLKIRFEFDT